MPVDSVDFVTPDCHPTLNRRDERNRIKSGRDGVGRGDCVAGIGPVGLV